MKIAVGSKNPVKIQAVKNVVDKIWPGSTVEGVEVEHKTCSQPSSNQEAIQGAIERAKLCIKKLEADYGFGLEGNTCELEQGMFLEGWVVVIDKSGNHGIGSCGSIQMPDQIAQEIKRGKELGPVTDKLFGHENIKQKEGTVGLLTNNIVTRTEAFEKGIAYALARFINPEYYKKR